MIVYLAALFILTAGFITGVWSMVLGLVLRKGPLVRFGVWVLFPCGLAVATLGLLGAFAGLYKSLYP